MTVPSQILLSIHDLVHVLFDTVQLLKLEQCNQYYSVVSITTYLAYK